jgi:predicted ester cyclase
MGTEENKALVRKYFELYNQQDLDACDEITDWFTEDYTRELDRQVNIIMFSAFPDLKYTVVDMIAEEDRVAIVRIMSGTHTGEPFRGIPATGKKVEEKAVIIVRIVDNKFVEGSYISDPSGFWQPLGVLPSFEEALQAYKEANNLE